MKMIIWIKVEIANGGVKICDGSWAIGKGLDEKILQGDCVQIIERQLNERIMTIESNEAPPPPAAPSSTVIEANIVAPHVADAPLPEEYTNWKQQGTRADGRAAPMVNRSALYDELSQLGISPDEGKGLIDRHGSTRIQSLLKWMSAKTEPVGNPLALLMKCLGEAPKRAPSLFPPPTQERRRVF